MLGILQAIVLGLVILERMGILISAILAFAFSAYVGATDYTTITMPEVLFWSTISLSFFGQAEAVLKLLFSRTPKHRMSALLVGVPVGIAFSGLICSAISVMGYVLGICLKYAYPH